MAVKSLPENYKAGCSISMKKNIKLAFFLNIGAILLLIPYIIGLFFILKDKLDKVGGEITIPIKLYPILICLAGIILITILHELVHGFFFKLYSNDKVKYGFHGLFASAGSPDYYFKKKEYMIIGIAPFIIINLLLFLILPFVSGTLFYILYIITAIHFAGCIGDLYVIAKLVKYKPDTLINDNGMEMEFYIKENLDK